MNTCQAAPIAAIAAPCTCNCEYAQRARQKAIDDGRKARDYATACRNWAAGEPKTADELDALRRGAGITALQHYTGEGLPAYHEHMASAAWRKTLKALRAGRCRTPDEYRALLKAAGVRRSDMKDGPCDGRTDAVQVSAAWRKQLAALRAGQ